MSVYPVQLELHDRLCVVVGGGQVGRRKAEGLLAAGARVRLVEPQDEAPACYLAGVERVARGFEPHDLEGVLLVFAASNDPQLNQRVSELARQHGLLCNRVDDPVGGDFSLPAQLRRGELLLTVSTGGGHPAFAAALRDRLAEEFDGSWTFIVALARALRRRRLTPGEAETYNHTVMRVLLDARLPGLVAACDRPGVERLLHESLGSEVTLAELDLSLPMDKS